jgi:uncharacterized protein YecT (DUF1311 family)
MLKALLLPFLCGCVLLQDAPVDAQEPKVDCKKAEAQMELTYCAEQQLNAADKALNVQYQITRKQTRKWDADADAGDKGAEDALVKAQRAWVAYRDAQCTSYGYQAHRGSMEPMLIYGCQADLTTKRTAELKDLAEVLGK